MIDIRIPRQAVYKSFKGNPGTCPRCGGELVNKHQTYAVATRRGKRVTDSFIIGGNFGWFCRSGPTVVINRDEIGKMLGFQKSGWNVGSEYVVLGIVNLDAIPDSKRNLPIGDPNNPLPLIEFSESAKPANSANRPK